MSDYHRDQDLDRLVGNRKSQIIRAGSTYSSSTWERVLFLRNSRIKQLTNTYLGGALATGDTIIAGGVIGGKITKIEIQAGLAIAVE